MLLSLEKMLHYRLLRNETHYTFTHHGITGPLYYYRIKQVDIDGRFTSSKMLIISTNRDVNQMVLLNNTGVGKWGYRSITDKPATLQLLC